MSGGEALSWPRYYRLGALHTAMRPQSETPTSPRIAHNPVGHAAVPTRKLQGFMYGHASATDMMSL